MEELYQRIGRQLDKMVEDTWETAKMFEESKKQEEKLLIDFKVLKELEKQKMKKKLIIIMGKSGSGKSHLSKELAKNLKLHEIVSTTSRPMREKEVNGRDYLFKTKEEVEQINKDNGFYEFNTYNNWHYGIEKGNIPLEEKHCVAVVTPTGYKQLQRTLGNDNIIAILINTKDKLRLKRSLDREVDPNCEEICRRLLSDKIDFCDIEQESNIINIRNDYEFNEVYKTLEDVVKFLLVNKR